MRLLGLLGRNNVNLYVRQPKRQIVTEQKPALVVVDMINDYMDPDGELYGEFLHDIIPNVEQLLTAFRAENLPIVFANTSTVTDEQPMVEKWGRHAERGTWGERVIDDISPQESDYVVRKPMYDAFHDTELDHLLRSVGATKTVVTGVDSHVCVLQTGIGACNRGYDVTVVEDGMTTKEQYKHEFAIEYTKSHLGQVESTDHVVELIEQRWTTAD